MEKKINVAEIAELSMLSCDFKDAAKIEKDMIQMLEFVRVMENEDINDRHDRINVNGDVNVFREDIPGDIVAREALLDIAPKTKDGYIYVPTVIERE